jgi:chromosome segregation ATPase
MTEKLSEQLEELYEAAAFVDGNIEVGAALLSELFTQSQALEQQVERLEFNYDTCRNVYEQEQEARLALEQRVEELEGALKGADSLLDAMAVADIKRWLKPAERPLYARVHTEVRETLASQEEA